MLINRWFSLGAATWLEFSAGLVYTFSIFSGSIKAANGYSQVQLQGLGAAVVSGGLAAWIPGLTYDRLLQRHLKLAPRSLPSGRRHCLLPCYCSQYVHSVASAVCDASYVAGWRQEWAAHCYRWGRPLQASSCCNFILQFTLCMRVTQVWPFWAALD